MSSRVNKGILAFITGIGVFLEVGWTFSSKMIHYKKQGKSSNRKRLTLSHIKINHPRNGYEEIYNRGKKWCFSQDMKDVYIRSEDGLSLHGRFFEADEPERTILLSHGYKGTGFGDFANIAGFLHENHCNLLFIDQRCCGESEGEYITFGAKEQLDVCSWAHYLAENDDTGLPIYLYGQSMGAASVLMASGHDLPDRVKGIISDCAFQSMSIQIKDMASKWFHLNWIGLLLFRIDLYCRLFAGFSMKEADTTYAMEHNTRPVLFFHGEKDSFVYTENIWRNYNICTAPKEMVVVPGARHLCSCYVEPELYRSKLLEFFKKYDLI